MTQIDTTSTINAIRLVEQGSNPASPAASHWLLFIKNDGLYIKDSAGNVTGPFGAGGGSVATDAIWDAKGDLAVGTGANTASKLTVGTDGKVLTAASGEATGLKWDTAGGGRTLISEQTPTGNAATWTTIPGTYWALRIEGVCRMDQPSVPDGFMYIYFNNDTTAANYRTQYQIDYSGGSGNQNGLDEPRIFWTSAVNAPANSACTFTIDIINYAGTAWWKSAIGHAMTTSATNNSIQNHASTTWANTSAITRIDLKAPTSQNWVSGTVMRLYGLA